MATVQPMSTFTPDASINPDNITFEIADAKARIPDLVVHMGTISALPVTKSVQGVTSDMVVVSAVLYTPSAQTGHWTVTTNENSVTVSGSISGSTSLTLHLCRYKTVYAT